MVDIRLDGRLGLSVEAGDERAFHVEITFDGDLVTGLSTNTGPWTVPGRVMLRNVIAKRLEEHYTRESVEELVERTLPEHEDELRALDA